MGVETVVELPEARVGTCGVVVVSYFRQAATMEAMRALDDVQQRTVDRFGALVGLSIIGQLGAGFRVDDDVRQMTVDMSVKYEKVGRGTAIVVLPKGLAAIAVRAFLTGYFLVSRSTAPSKTFGTVTDAAEWVKTLPNAPVTDLPLSGADLERFIA